MDVAEQTWRAAVSGRTNTEDISDVMPSRAAMDGKQVWAHVPAGDTEDKKMSHSTHPQHHDPTLLASICRPSLH